MIAWWVVLAGFAVGVGAAALASELGWLLQRKFRPSGQSLGGAVDGPTPPASSVCLSVDSLRAARRGADQTASPYDWSQEPDL